MSEAARPVEPCRLTDLLQEASGGNVDALNRLFPVVYDTLRDLARSRLRAERDGHSLNTTALVHETYLKLVDQTRVEWKDRAHFYAVASQAMRRILVSHARAKGAAKRGGDAIHVALEAAPIALPSDSLDELIALDQALERLEEFNPRGARTVEYRFFGGLSYEEIGEALGTSAVTARRAWTAAKAWLERELRETP
jgi:RNA polymerase sigma factor (TIGR02999 family)